MASKRTAKRKRQRIARKQRALHPRTPAYLRNIDHIAIGFYTPERIASLLHLSDEFLWTRKR